MCKYGVACNYNLTAAVLHGQHAHGCISGKSRQSLISRLRAILMPPGADVCRGRGAGALRGDAAGECRAVPAVAAGRLRMKSKTQPLSGNLARLFRAFVRQGDDVRSRGTARALQCVHATVLL